MTARVARLESQLAWAEAFAPNAAVPFWERNKPWVGASDHGTTVTALGFGTTKTLA